MILEIPLIPSRTLSLKHKDFQTHMRLWSLHPRHLDPKGLVAVWREALLAQAVILGKTQGYRHHPQLDRFWSQPSPGDAIAAYLRPLQLEALARGYAFNPAKIVGQAACPQIPLTADQLDYEWAHLLAKLRARNLPFLEKATATHPACHPLFVVNPGGIEPWERLKANP